LSILGLSGGAAQAAIVTFDLSGVTFSDGSTASGSFVFNSTADTISDINIVLTGGSLLPSLTLTGGGPTDVVALSGAVEFQILDPESSPFALNDLSLIVQTPVSLTSPNPIDVFSSPTSSGNPNNFTSTDFPFSRFIVWVVAHCRRYGGDLNPQISGVPEISTWAMMLIGFGFGGIQAASSGHRTRNLIITDNVQSRGRFRAASFRLTTLPVGPRACSILALSTRTYRRLQNTHGYDGPQP